MNITDSCLDAETLAAWVDGGLSGSELVRAQAHVADCDRCQTLVGTLARISSDGPATVAERSNRRWLAWLVPLAAAAAAVAVWVAVPPNERGSRASSPPPPELQSQAAKMIPQGPASPAPQAHAPAETPAPPPPPRAAELRKDDAASSSALDRVSKQTPSSRIMTAAGGAAPPNTPAPPQAVPAAPPLSASAVPPAQPQAASSNAFESGRSVQSANRREAPTPLQAGKPAEPLEILSPDPMFRWRIAGAVMQRSTNGGATWEVMPTGVIAELTAGSAPSPLICWVVGRSGVVLLSTDGHTWHRVPFPETTDLSAVRARDASTASLTTADGRTFSTTTTGAVWNPGPVQGFQTAPF